MLLLSVKEREKEKEKGREIEIFRAGDTQGLLPVYGNLVEGSKVDDFGAFLVLSLLLATVSRTLL